MHAGGRPVWRSLPCVLPSQILLDQALQQRVFAMPPCNDLSAGNDAPVLLPDCGNGSTLGALVFTSSDPPDLQALQRFLPAITLTPRLAARPWGTASHRVAV